MIGNALEFYDFTTSAVGFIGRPIGAIVIGRYSDRVGRKPAMLLSFTLMGIGILGIVLTPSYAMIGRQRRCCC